MKVFNLKEDAKYYFNFHSKPLFSILMIKHNHLTMKNWRILLLILPLMVSYSNDEVEKIADEFHTRLVSEDYNYIIENLTDGLTSSPEEMGQFF